MLGAAAADAATPDPRTTTRNALTRFLNDTRGVGRADASAATRRRLLTLALRIEGSSVSHPCRSVRVIRRYRALLPKVAERRTTPGGRRPGPASVRGTLERDALAVDAGLKQLPGTRRCGGGATRASTSLTTRVRRSSRRTLKMHVTLPVARWEARSGGGNDFIGLNMDGADFIGGNGDPGVPAFTRMFAVPRGARMSVRVSNARGYTLDGIDLFPKQEQAVDQDLPPDFPSVGTFADKPFRIDRGAYRGRNAIPRRLAFATVLGQMRDLRVGAVQVPGAQYDPRLHRARIFTSMDLTVTFKKSGGWLPKRVRTAQEAPFRRIYRSSLANYGTVARASASSAADPPPGCGEEYLIVTSPALRPAADKLSETKQKQGFVVGIHEVTPGTAATDVREFVRGEITSKTCRRPTYALLLGDTAHVPSFLETCPGIADCQVTSDLSYSLIGTADGFADVMLGRIPVNTLDLAMTTVSKIITYETELPAPPGDDFYNHATVTANFEGVGPQDSRGFTLSAERMRAGLRSRGHVVTRLNTAQSTADIQRFKDGTAIPDELRRPATPWTDGRDQVVNELNAGRFLFVHRDHGSRLGWANPGININDIGLLNSNSTKLPVVLSINCSSGGFGFPGNPSFVERLLTRQGGGAVAAIADTEVSPTVQNDQLTVGWADAMFPDTVPAFGSAQPLRRMGEILNAGKAYMASLAPASSQLTGQVYREHLLWHLLGDPSMEIRSAEPEAFDPTKLATKFVHRTDTFPVGDPSFRVRVTSTQTGTDGTLATLIHAGEAIGRATMTNGVAEITPTKRTDSASLSVALERDKFLARTLPVSAPVPNLTMTCPTEVDVPQEDNAQVSGTLSPKVSGATIRLRATRQDGTVITNSTTTDAASTWRVKMSPLRAADIGQVKVEAFFDGAGKYGSDDALCTSTVD
ncbi:MAG TPA: C25 family cysteine peptidase [Thermoleophilaceae bacterium]|nr:C25 family cysteine peptidase [Thermoleophilaceae bacterium]